MMDNFYFQITLSILFLSIIFSFGYLFTRKILKENTFFSTIPMSTTLGVSFFIFILHFISLITGLQIATYITLLLFITISIFLVLRFKDSEESNPLTKREGFLLLSLSTLVFLLCFFYLSFFNTYDPLYQLAATLIKQRTYPPMNAYNSEQLFSYHYGLILLASSLAVFSNIDIWNSFIPIQLLFQFSIPLSIFSLIYFCKKDFNCAFFSALFGCFCANLSSILLPIDIARLFPEGYERVFQKIMYLADSSFANGAQRAFVSPNMGTAIQMSLVLFYLCFNLKLDKQLYWKLFSIFTISVSLFFIYESYWVAPIAGSLIFHFFNFMKNKNESTSIKLFSYLLIMFLLSPFIIGGVTNNSNSDKNSFALVYFNPKTYITSFPYYPGHKTSDKWLKEHTLIEASQDGTFFKVSPFDWKFYEDFGLPFLCLPLILFWIKRQKDLKSFSLFSSALLMLSVPFFISYQIRDVEFIRFPTYARFIFSILFGSFLGFYVKEYSKSVFTKSLFLILIFVLISPSIFWLLPIKSSSKDWRYAQIPTIHKKAIKWLSKKVEVGDKGIGPINTPTFYYELISTAGVYGTGTSNTGGFSFEKETRKTALKTLDPCLLRDLKVRWLYVNSDVEQLISKENLKKLSREKQLFLRYEDKNKDDFVRIYEFIPSYREDLCLNKLYRWAVGRVYYGKFYPLQNNLTKEKLVFFNKDGAKDFLKEYTKALNSKEAYWYRIEAIEN